MDNNLKRSIILEHYQNPTNKGLIDDDSYQRVRANNESCIDDITLQIKTENNIIKDIRFEGEACAISTSAASIMINLLLNKNFNEALTILNEYEKMINEQEYDENILGEAVVYNEIYKQPNRKKCALLPWRGINEIIKR
jgi:nitrogen fixation protein NifU and related proteins